MGNLWKTGQVGTRVLAGAAGALIGGPAGAAIGAGVVGPMIADLAFGPGSKKEETLYNWNEPSSFMSYQDNPATRLSATTITQDPNLGFKGGLKTFDALAGTVGPFLPTGGLLAKAAQGMTGAPKVAENAFGETGSLFEKTVGGLVKGNAGELNPFAYRDVISKWAGNTSKNMVREIDNILQQPSPLDPNLNPQSKKSVQTWGLQYQEPTNQWGLL